MTLQIKNCTQPLLLNFHVATHFRVVVTMASLENRDLSQHMSLYPTDFFPFQMSIGYNPITIRKILWQHKLALKTER